MPRAPVAAAATLLAACTTTLGLDDLDRLERSAGARTLVVEEHYTLRSPLDLEATRTWDELVRRELAGATTSLGWSLTEPVQIVLVEIEERRLVVEGTAQGFSIERRPDPLHGVQGMAAARLIVMPVTPPSSYTTSNGDSIPVVRPVWDYAHTLRHEIAHTLARDAGVGGASWLVEGLAHYVESLKPLATGGLGDVGPPAAAVQGAGKLSRDERELTRLVDWREDSGAVARGQEQVDVAARTLCGLFVRFLLEQDGQGTPLAAGAGVAGLGPRLEALSRRSRADLLALEAAWLRWLDAQVQGLQDRG